jgi:hypothetical protein
VNVAQPGLDLGPSGRLVQHGVDQLHLRRALDLHHPLALQPVGRAVLGLAALLNLLVVVGRLGRLEREIVDGVATLLELALEVGAKARAPAVDLEIVGVQPDVLADELLRRGLDQQPEIGVCQGPARRPGQIVGGIGDGADRQRGDQRLVAVRR